MSRRRAGFTLIELLVVIAIIAILIGLLLPAVQKVREAAARSQCQNNLKQVALGAMNYEGTFSTLMPGESYQGQTGTWAIPLLPYIEQENIFRQYQGFGNTTGTTPNYSAYNPTATPPLYNGGPQGSAQGVTNQTIKTLVCPSDPRGGSSNVWVNGTVALSKHNYAANFGNTVRRGLNVDSAFNTCTAGATGCISYGGAPFKVTSGNGAVSPGLLQPQTLLGITDGTSNTLMFGEIKTGSQSPADLRGLIWWGPSASITTFYQPNTSGNDQFQTGTPLVNEPAIGMPIVAASLTVLASRSAHTGGVSGAMCDGSVRFVTNSVDLQTWRAVGTSQGGEVIQLQ